ncbi:MAG TPA: chorismate lyase [Gammaproteobacteria bacterium]|nr:chorismate lyase [Gammaproteobacteria bacterium]
MKNSSVEARAAAGFPTGWHSPDTISDTARPAELWPWLVEPGSLTARLRAACGDAFRVRVLMSAASEVTADEAEWFGHPHAFVREVYLCSGGTPWVYARTLVLDGSPSEARLRTLGETPLGDGAFGRASTRRESLEVARLDHPMFADALPQGVAAVWARRSVLRVDGEPLHIAEYFLDGPTPWT